MVLYIIMYYLYSRTSVLSTFPTVNKQLTHLHSSSKAWHSQSAFVLGHTHPLNQNIDHWLVSYKQTGDAALV